MRIHRRGCLASIAPDRGFGCPETSHHRSTGSDAPSRGVFNGTMTLCKVVLPHPSRSPTHFHPTPTPSADGRAPLFDHPNMPRRGSVTPFRPTPSCSALGGRPLFFVLQAFPPGSAGIAAHPTPRLDPGWCLSKRGAGDPAMPLSTGDQVGERREDVLIQSTQYSGLNSCSEMASSPGGIW